MTNKEAMEKAWEEYSCAESIALERVAFINGYQAALALQNRRFAAYIHAVNQMDDYYLTDSLST